MPGQRFLDAVSFASARAADWLRWSSPARYLLDGIDEDEFERLMFDWHWRADVAYWKAEKALRGGRKEAAVELFARALELNVPGYTWPALEVRLRLEGLDDCPPEKQKPARKRKE